MFYIDLVVHPLSEAAVDYFENRPNIFVSGAEIANIIDEHATLLGKKSTVSIDRVPALPTSTRKIHVIHHDGRELPTVYGVKYTPHETKLADLEPDLFSLMGLPQASERCIWGWCSNYTNRSRFGGLLRPETIVPEMDTYAATGYQLTAWRVPVSDSYHMFDCMVQGLTTPTPPIFLPTRDPIVLMFALRPFVKPPAIADALLENAIHIPNPNLITGTNWNRSTIFLGQDWGFDSFLRDDPCTHPSASPRALLPGWIHEGRRRHSARLMAETSAEWVHQALQRCANTHKFRIAVVDSRTLRLEIFVPHRHSLIVPRMNELNTERWDIATYISEQFPSNQSYISKVSTLIQMDEHDPMAEQPSSIKIPLKHHQLQNLHRMLHIEKETNLATTLYTRCNVTTWIDPRTKRLRDVTDLLGVSGGFLSDTVGLGKTLSVIALCAEHPPPHGMNTLVLCPPSILIQWKTEIEKYSSLRVLEYHGKRKHGVTRDTFLAYDIILTTYSTYMQNEIFTTPHRIPWHRVVYDEAHTMSERYTHTSNIIEARHRWCVTATPFTNIDRQFKALGIPMRINDPGLATMYYILSPLMIRHTQPSQLPRLVVEDVAVSFQTEREQALYERALAHVINDVRGSQSFDTLRLHSHMTTLRRLCTAGSWSFESLFNVPREPSLVVDYTLVAPHDEDDVCPICMNIYDHPVITTCNHWFCMDCIATALTFPPANCPMCRNPQTTRDLRAGVLFGQTPEEEEEVLDTMETDDDAFVECSSKVNHMLHMMETFDAGDKSIVFCESSTTIPIIISALKARGFKPRCIHGSMAAIQRGNAIRAFQEDPTTNVFVSSLRSAAAGINLTAANHIFFLGPVLNDANYTQAIGRAHRTGQVRDITVHRLYMQGTLETELRGHRQWTFDALRSLFV